MGFQAVFQMGQLCEFSFRDLVCRNPCPQFDDLGQIVSSHLHFAILAFFIGCFQGSIQSLSRSYYSKIIPAENSGEYFGIYDIFSKGASFLGSAVIAAVKLAGGTINVAVACLAVFFALGFLFLRIADKQKAIR